MKNSLVIGLIALVVLTPLAAYGQRGGGGRGGGGGGGGYRGGGGGFGGGHGSGPAGGGMASGGRRAAPGYRAAGPAAYMVRPGTVRVEFVRLWAPTRIPRRLVPR